MPQQRQKHPVLDPRAPLVIDTHELGRRPGSMRRVQTTVAAPADFGNAVVGVVEGTDLVLDLRLESVLEGVLVSGTVTGRYSGECVRCLGPLDGDVEAEVQELYAYDESEAEEDEANRMDGVYLDLEPEARDQLVLAMPLQPLDADDCPGLCVECGARLADDPDHHHDEVDARWAGLAALVGDGPAPAGEPTPDTTSTRPHSALRREHEEN